MLKNVQSFCGNGTAFKLNRTNRTENEIKSEQNRENRSILMQIKEFDGIINFVGKY